MPRLPNRFGRSRGHTPQIGTAPPGLILPSTGLLLQLWAGTSSSQLDGRAYLESDAILACQDGDPVGSLKDWSPSAHDFATPILAQRPTLRGSGLGTNSRPHLEFTGTQILYKSGLAGIGIDLNAYTIYLVIGNVSTTAHMFPFAQSDASTRQYIQFNDPPIAPNRIEFAHSDDSGTYSSIHSEAPTLTNGNAHLITAVRSAKNSFKLLYDGSQLNNTGTASPGPSTTTITSIGARFRLGSVISNQYEGMIGLLAIYDNDNVATIFDGSTIESKINTFYGVF
jgi:hypothetical protein